MSGRSYKRYWTNAQLWEDYRYNRMLGIVLRDHGKRNAANLKAAFALKLLRERMPALQDADEAAACYVEYSKGGFERSRLPRGSAVSTFDC